MSATAPTRVASGTSAITWRFAHFDQLTPGELYDILQLRTAVFVMEQNCVFQDMDGADPKCWHLSGMQDGRIVAYCRLVPAGVKYAEPSIGRVITPLVRRGTGLGRELMREALARAQKLWPGQALRIGAQAHLQRFYGEFGFTKASEPYDEDGILHVEMVRAAR